MSYKGLLIIRIGNAFRDLKNAKIYPSIGMKRPHAQISVNFGQKPFFYRIEEMMSVSIIQYSMTDSSRSCIHSPKDRESQIRLALQMSRTYISL